MFLVGLKLLCKDGLSLSLFLPYQYVKFNPNFKKLLSYRTLFQTRLILKHRRGKIDPISTWSKVALDDFIQNSLIQFFSSTFLFAWCLLSTIAPGGSFLQSALPKIFSPFTFSHKHDFHFNLSSFCYSFWIKTLGLWDFFFEMKEILSQIK